MLSRLVNSALEKLSVKESTSSKSPELSYPTLSFPLPPPAGTGSRSLCARCLTLLSHAISQYGDGTDYKGLEITHSSSIATLSEVGQSKAPPCVICAKTFALFEAARAHVAFETSLRNTPSKEWSLTWRVNERDPKIHPQFGFSHDSVSFAMTVTHTGGYGWGIGGFKVFPDGTVAAAENAEQKHNLGDYPAIVSLDPNQSGTGDLNAGQLELDFSSTLSTGSLALISMWAQECAKSHQKCHKVFGSNGFGDLGVWFPNRLIHVTRTPNINAISGQSEVTITGRVVVKSNPVDFPDDKATKRITYLSLSHCWGPPPNPSASLQGRASTVLTESNLPLWQKDLPLDDLPLTFQHAITICAALGFEYMWIDSLCILQDSFKDWQEQSAVMGDVYKFAWLNVAALSSTSDYEGFINDSRDPRVEFGFSAPFASILGRGQQEKNYEGQECILLRGRAKLYWNFAYDLPGTASNAPLFKRAWVYQEKNLARRTLGFAKTSVYWACDEYSQSEQSGRTGGGLESDGLRGMLHSVLETAKNAVAVGQRAMSEEQRRELINRWDMRWTSTVTAYTLCQLTKHTDKLIAVSSIARELDNAKVIGKRYLAGLWDVNLPFQMAWITVQGEATPPRKRVGDAEYVAPSWSWASVEAPVQPRSIFPAGDRLIALADVRAAEVELATDFAFGSVKAGWLRVCGRLNRVKAAERKSFYSWDKSTKSTSLTDELTGEKLWFCSDTVEGHELVQSGKGKKVVWMPLTLRIDARMVECHCLCLVEVPVEERSRREDAFVKTGEKVYRRIGTGNFGRIPSMLRQERLLMQLGTFPDTEVKDGKGQELAKDFKRREDGLEEFVLI